MPTYVGNCEWELIGERGASGGDIATIIQTYEGRADKLEEFKRGFVFGRPAFGGYITGVQPTQEMGPFGRLEVTISLPPDFNAVRNPPTYSVHSAVKQEILVDQNTNPKVKYTMLKREIIYRAPTQIFNYFASSRPGGPRHTSAAGEPRILSDRLTVQNYTEDWAYVDGGQIKAGDTIPLSWKQAVVFRKDVDAIVESATPIPGTPWWRCQDSVTEVLEGDAVTIETA